MNQDIAEDKIKCEKLKLHIRYIIFMCAACVTLVVILSFCEDTMFKNCVSVASTVTSIILSVIAIILSVTGERTTNEIRNKVSDSVGQLEACTTKSSGLAEELTATLQQLNQLYSNINEKILNPMHLSEEGLKSHITQNEDFSVFEKDYIEKAESISGFLNVLPIQTRQGVKKRAEVYAN